MPHSSAFQPPKSTKLCCLLAAGGGHICGRRGWGAAGAGDDAGELPAALGGGQPALPRCVDAAQAEVNDTLSVTLPVSF